MSAERGLRLTLGAWALAWALWFSGLGGTELYKLPLFLWALWVTFILWRGRGPERARAAALWAQGAAERWGTPLVAGATVWTFAAWCGVFLAQYYSFELNVWDAGLHSNILGNLARGRLYSSYLDIHPWGDHFTPLMAPLALPYVAFPSVLWLMAFKAAAFALTGWLLYRTAREAPGLGPWGPLVGAGLSLAWLWFYGPAVRALAYEFQASSLAPPLVVWAFASLQRERWRSFALALVLMLGAKEHLGAVWIGLGLFLLSGPKKGRLLGGLLVLGGLLAVGGIMFGLMPWFREGLPAWSGPERIAPLKDLDLKTEYIFKLLFPLGLLPLLHWRAGLLAAPAVGVNLLSGWPAMYSTDYHYDDLSSVLLLLGLIPAFSALRGRSSGFWGRRRVTLALLALLVFAHSWPRSPLRYLYRSWPDSSSLALSRQLERFAQAHPEVRLAVADRIGAHFSRERIEVIEVLPGEECAETYRHYRTEHLPEPRWVVFLPGWPDPQIAEPAACLQSFLNSPDFVREPSWAGLAVFENRRAQAPLAAEAPTR